jgi:hypothetical protein
VPTPPATTAISSPKPGHSRADTNTQINRAFQQLFHGDAVTERAGFEAGSNANGPLAYLTDWANNDAGTEGMLYLMSFLHVNGNFRISDWKLGAP